MRYLKQQLLLFIVLMVLLTSSAIAQFDEPQIIKIEGANAAEFEELSLIHISEPTRPY